MSDFPKYEIVMTVSDMMNDRPFSILETIDTLTGPRTYIRLRGFKSVNEAVAALRKKGKTVSY